MTRTAEDPVPKAPLVIPPTTPAITKRARARTELDFTIADTLFESPQNFTAVMRLTRLNKLLIVTNLSIDSDRTLTVTPDGSLHELNRFFGCIPVLARIPDASLGPPRARICVRLDLRHRANVAIKVCDVYAPFVAISRFNIVREFAGRADSFRGPTERRPALKDRVAPNEIITNPLIRIILCQ